MIPAELLLEQANLVQSLSHRLVAPLPARDSLGDGAAAPYGRPPCQAVHSTAIIQARRAFGESRVVRVALSLSLAGETQAVASLRPSLGRGMAVQTSFASVERVRTSSWRVN
ncbi:hypothetical protein [Rhodopirellula bahusiensis]|uniref:hypothetical protein n=1 Tax=Rhodopirellula bahusiensis TaxID=2014065 RepID=UPI003266F58C